MNVYDLYNKYSLEKVYNKGINIIYIFRYSWNKVMPKLVDSSTNTYFEMRQPSTSDYELAAANSKRVDNMFTFINNKLHRNKPDDVTRLHAAYIDKEMNVINNVMTEMSQKYPHFAW